MTTCHSLQPPFATQCTKCAPGRAAKGYANKECIYCDEHPKVKKDVALGYNVSLKTFSSPNRDACRTCGKGEYATNVGCKFINLKSLIIFFNPWELLWRLRHAFGHIGEKCHSGRYAPSAVNLPPDSSTGCYETPPGFYATKDGRVSRANMTGATAIAACEAGTFSKGNSTMCKICPAGFYSKTRASECRCIYLSH